MFPVNVGYVHVQPFLSAVVTLLAYTPIPAGVVSPSSTITFLNVLPYEADSFAIVTVFD